MDSEKKKSVADDEPRALSKLTSVIGALPSASTLVPGSFSGLHRERYTLVESFPDSPVYETYGKETKERKRVGKTGNYERRDGEGEGEGDGGLRSAGVRVRAGQAAEEMQMGRKRRFIVKGGVLHSSEFLIGIPCSEMNRKSASFLFFLKKGGGW